MIGWDIIFENDPTSLAIEKVGSGASEGVEPSTNVGAIYSTTEYTRAIKSF